MALALHLEARGIRYVVAPWKLAYFQRLQSSDRIRAASGSPARFPGINALAELSGEAWRIDLRPEREVLADSLEHRIDHYRGVVSPDSARPGMPAEDIYVVRRTPARSPQAFVDTLGTLDRHRTLYAHFEPYPLLPRAAYPRDWQGWPYRSSANLLEAIVWRLERFGVAEIPQARVAAALKECVLCGEFRLAAQWNGSQIFKRYARGPAPAP